MGGTEYNVGGPTGGPNRVENIRDVPFESLNPGDTVRIHWRPTAYSEKVTLFRSGTADRPIRICGVRGGPDGSRPVITGLNARSRSAEVFRGGTVGALQNYGVLVISGMRYGARVEHVIVEDLRIGDTRDANNAVGSFVNASGASSTYDGAAACVRIRQAAFITLRSNEIVNCSDGVFAQSLPDNESSLVRNLVLEGNYIHGNAVIGNESRHQAYLQGMDVLVQGNYFGPPRSMPSIGVAAGNQLKTRVAGLIVRYNYFVNGARMLDIVEAEEHISFIAPWRWAEQRLRLGLSTSELAAADARQQADWRRYQAAHVYGNLLHIVGREGATTNLPTNLVHYGFDNSQHDRQPGVLWFFHNTVLWETDRNNLATVRLFDYGSDFNPGDYYDGLGAQVRNVGDALHYATRSFNNVCIQVTADCTDWGRMLQTVAEDFGRMRAFNNAFVQKSYTQGLEHSEIELTRNRWDQLELSGVNVITSGWNVDRNPGDGQGGGYGRRVLPAANVYPGANDVHHVSGAETLVEASALPIDVQSFAPLANGGLRNRASPFDTRVPDVMLPRFSPTRGSLAGELNLVNRTSWSTVGAVEQP